MTETRSGLPRRRLLASGLAVAGTTVLWSTGVAGVAGATPAPTEQPTDRWQDGTTLNGWPVVSRTETHPHRIEGSGLDVELLPGDAAVVLLHVARRFHYEVDVLRSGEVTGHLADRSVAQPYESNHLSGTALALRPGAYPVGVGGGLYPQQLDAVRHILAECQDVVRWGGDEPTPKESHLEIAVRPGDTRLERLAATVRQWNSSPGRGAGAVNQSVSPT